VIPTRERAASTVLDVCLFCLLVGAAAAVLTTVPAPADDRDADRADEAAAALARATATVDHEVCAPDGDACLARSDRGTLAGLLGRAAVANATVEGRPLDPTRGGFVAAVRGRVAATLPSLAPDVTVGVTAVWRPYEGAPLSGRLRVGPRPPPTADVHAATLSVPSGVAVDRARLRRADDRRDVARVVAWGVVRGLFPEDAATAALRADGPTGAVAAARYRGAAGAVGVGVDGHLSGGDAAAANLALAVALTDLLAADLRERFPNHEAAAAAVAAGRVRIVVRTWSA